MISLKKIIFPLTFCFLALSISSCSDDSDDDNAPAPAPAPAQKIASSTLVGDWEMVSLNYAGTTSDVVGGQTLTSSFSGIGRDFTYQITFNDNPKTFSTSGGYTVDLTSLFQGQVNTQSTTVPDTQTSGTWNLVGNTLTLTDANTNQTNSTEILTGNQDSFSYDFAGLFGRSLGGANVKFTSGQVGFSRL